MTLRPVVIDGGKVVLGIVAVLPAAAALVLYMLGAGAWAVGNAVVNLLRGRPLLED